MNENARVLIDNKGFQEYELGLWHFFVHIVIENNFVFWTKNLNDLSSPSQK